MRSYAIIPAAGRSRRMGQPKLLLPWRGTTVIEHVLTAWREAGVTRLVAVVRRDDPTLAEKCRIAGCDVVTPEVDPPDMKTSIRHALEHVANHDAPDNSDVWMLAPADQPRLSAATARRLLADHDPTRPAILVPAWRGRRGHPVLFPWPFAEEVRRLSENEGVNRLLERLPVREIEVDDPAIADDLDTPLDYQRLTDQ